MFMPQNMFGEFVLNENTTDDYMGICINYGLLIDFLHLSLMRGSRVIEFISWSNLDFISLRLLSIVKALIS